jgi:hypothetical protein
MIGQRNGFPVFLLAALLGVSRLLLTPPLPAMAAGGDPSSKPNPFTVTSTSAMTSTTRIAFGEDVVAIDVVIANETVTGGGRARVPLGSEVRLTVTADISDEVHLHGYDLRAPLSPEAPFIVEFTADIPGIFEMELEGGHQLLLELEVRP